ncbi:MAG TPA: tRNA uridine-5-carboxymethylaminomethyl(34) synthesis GTPase MnmE, partial [Flavobacteriales bacterium]|nr:tRNA uridine-5-carboxymethylaminomethyl(34) synthesis GTPase MnmE [Flavobacteriales bacterium]
MLKKSATICALSTAPGSGAIAVIRVSGPASVAVVNGVFSKEISNAGGYTAHYGQIQREGVIIDDVVLTVFRSPQSFTGEDSVEIACHGSKYIQQQLLQLLYEHGCDPATPGEFTKRAFLNGKMDLSQAEAVADLIASESAAAHRLAMYQMKGGFSGEI